MTDGLLSGGLIVVGLAGLMFGSDWAVRGAQDIARRAGWSPMLIGLTVLSIGTSLPEIATNVAVGVDLHNGIGSSGLAVGNVVGSCLSQITLLLGVTAVFGTMRFPRRMLWLDGSMVLIAALAMWLVCADGVATRNEALVLIVAYLLYLAARIMGRDKSAADHTAAGKTTAGKTTGDGAEETESNASGADSAGSKGARDILSIPKALALVAVGLVVVVFCAGLVVDNGVLIARSFGISEGTIGLWVGVGTGLPELTVAVRAIRVGGGTMSLGNLLGSNITDPMLSFGCGVVVHDMAVDNVALGFDFPFWIGATVLTLLIAHHRLRFDRKHGVFLVLVFAAFIAIRALGVTG